MKAALVLGLVFLCGLTRGDTGNELWDSLNNLLARSGIDADTDKQPIDEGKGNEDKPKEEVTVPPGTEDPCKDVTCENEKICKKGNCVCRDGLSGDNCEIVDGCATLKETCGEKECIYDPNTAKKATCECEDDKKLDGKVCKKTCDDADNAAEANKCSFDATCKPGDGYKFCECPDGLSGDMCETVDECLPSGKFKNCIAAGGECTFEGGNAVCKCKNNKEYDTKSETCRETCDAAVEGKKCSFNAQCTLRDGHKFCDCPQGLTGDQCEIVNDCKPTGKFEKCTAEVGVCTFEGTNSVCKCMDNNKAFDTKLGVCRDTCDDKVADKNCANEAKCIVTDGLGFCNCTKGLTGDRCQDITECLTGKLAACNSGGGTCTYTGGRAFCDCGLGKQFHEKTNKCRTICDPKNSQCKNEAQCEGKDDMTFCSCAEGLSGDLCEVITACEPTGELKNCKTGGGTCKFSAGKASCDCGEGKLFDISDGKCKDSCGSVICRNGAQCKDSVCQCPDGTSKPDCRIVDGCTKELEDICKKISSKCVYDSRRDALATCQCAKVNEKFDGETCKNCTCGKNEECYFDEAKEQQCPCIDKFAKDDKICKECDCGAFGTCSFNEGKKVCDCEDNYKDNLGTCQKCDCGESGSCKFDDKGLKVCTCDKNFALKDGTCVECNCGDDDEAVSCKFVKGSKVCTCKPSFEDNNGTCTECNCGDKTKAESCKFIEGKKTCKCLSMFAQYEDDECEACECGDKTQTSGCKFIDGEQQCYCLPKFAQKDKKCEACDCGFGDCSFDDSGNKACKCKSGYKENKDGMCAACDCGKNGDCSFDGENNKVCTCSNGFADKEGKCEACDCGSNGKCRFEKKIKTCECDSGYKVKGNICVATCATNDDCKNDGQCKGNKDTGDLFCECGKGFTGDLCEKITACVKGDFKDCESSGGTCFYDTVKKGADCKCEEGKKFDPVIKRCRVTCNPDDNKCDNGAKCLNNLCSCNTGTSGDNCSKVDGCDEALEKKCKSIEASCVYDANAPKQATCKCSNTDKKYNGVKCIPEWCDPDPCKSDSTCDYRNGSAYCKCNKEGQYYNYATEKCIDIDKCLSKTCEENKICEDGKCVCGENFEEKDTVCKPKKLCESSKPCYSKADCTEGDAGIVKCDCPANTYYKATTNACEDGVCSLPGKRETCKASCPDSGLKRENGECVPQEDKYKCTDDKDCGPFGYCVKKADKSTCACIAEIAKKDKDVCVLNEKVCASGKTQKDDPNKCDCSGMFKMSTNEITCEPLTCGDEVAQKDCKEKRGFCVDTKNPRTGYKCECPFGQELVTGKGCIDVCSNKATQDSCSKDQQTCYVNEAGKGICKCPPGFTENAAAAATQKTCEPSAQFAYLLKQLPVLSKGFVSKDNSVNKAKLNEDVIKSMQAVYKNYEFASVQSYSVKDGVILCDVWINFNAKAEQDIKRWRSQIVETDKESILPPSLFLSQGKLDDVTAEKLAFCSDTVRKTACGQGTTCDKTKKSCTCMDGYKVIPNSVLVFGDNTVMRCEDIDECLETLHNCTDNSECVNTIGSFSCKCNPGFHKKNQNESEECVELCSPNPCNNGDCQLKENKVECSCQVGYKGSYCTESDDKLKQAQHSTKVVGAVLGTLLAVTFVAIIAYIVKLKKNSYSEDFSPSPRDNSEMAERPLRGVSNRGYQ